VMRPKPSAMTKAAAMSTQISRGMRTVVSGRDAGSADTIVKYAPGAGRPRGRVCR
jgi:hypothetical protein